MEEEKYSYLHLCPLLSKNQDMNVSVSANIETTAKTRISP